MLTVQLEVTKLGGQDGFGMGTSYSLSTGLPFIRMEVFPLYFTGQTWVIGHTQGNHRQRGLAMIPIPVPN